MSRICTKLTVAGHARPEGLYLSLHLKLALPPSDRMEMYDVMSDEQVKLLRWQAHAINAANEVDANDASAKVAPLLGVGVSEDAGSFVDVQKSGLGVIQSDGGIKVFAPPLDPYVAGSPSMANTGKPKSNARFFIVSLVLLARDLLNGPRHPRVVRFALPVCLDNQMLFRPVLGPGGATSSPLAIEFSPRLLSSRRAGSSAGSPQGTPIINTVDLPGIDGDEAASPSDVLIGGKFMGGSRHMTIRMSEAPSAGSVYLMHEGAAAQTSVLDVKSNGPGALTARVRCRTTITLRDPHYPYVSHSAGFRVQLTFPGGTLGRLVEVSSVTASTTLLKWHSSAQRPSEKKGRASIDAMRQQVDAKRQNGRSTESGAPLQAKDLNEQAGDESNLLVTRPPPGFDTDDLDTTLISAPAPAPVSDKPEPASGHWIALTLDPAGLCDIETCAGGETHCDLRVSFETVIELAATVDGHTRKYALPSFEASRGHTSDKVETEISLEQPQAGVRLVDATLVKDAAPHEAVEEPTPPIPDVEASVLNSAPQLVLPDPTRPDPTMPERDTAPLEPPQHGASWHFRLLTAFAIFFLFLGAGRERQLTQTVRRLECEVELLSMAANLDLRQGFFSLDDQATTLRGVPEPVKRLLGDGASGSDRMPHLTFAQNQGADLGELVAAPASSALQEIRSSSALELVLGTIFDVVLAPFHLVFDVLARLQHAFVRP